jgi:hypothetical protein
VSSRALAITPKVLWQKKARIITKTNSDILITRFGTGGGGGRGIDFRNFVNHKNCSGKNCKRPPRPLVTSFVSLSYPILYNFLESSTIIFRIKVSTFLLYIFSFFWILFWYLSRVVCIYHYLFMAEWC